MKKFFSAYLVAVALAFVSCSLGNDDEALSLSAWQEDHGMPSSYQVKTLEISSIPVVSMKAERSNAPSTGYSYAAFGKTDELSRDYYLDFAFNFTKGNKKFIAAFRADTATVMELRLFPLYYFYEALSDSLPFTENLAVNISWKLDSYEKKSSLDSITEVADSIWYDTLLTWQTKNSFDSTYDWTFKGDSLAMYLGLPDTFVTALRDTNLLRARLQMKISATEAFRTYRFYGSGSSSYTPSIRITTGDSSYYLTPFRSAILASGNPASETMLYAGTRDSLIFELDGQTITSALSKFYGDEFPWNKGNGMDVRQAVVLAQISMKKDDSQGNSELSYPIQVVASSFDEAYDDSLESRVTEAYKLNYSAIKATGHPNLVFYDNSDSLTLQVTYGMRDFVNRASELDNVKLMLRLGYPILSPQDTVYGDYVNSDGDTVYFFFDYFDFAKYDFASALENGVNMKLWLLSKRGEDD